MGLHEAELLIEAVGVGAAGACGQLHNAGTAVFRFIDRKTDKLRA